MDVYLSEVEAAEKSLWLAFPGALMIAVEYSYVTYPNKAQDRYSTITIRFSDRRPLYVIGETMAEALQLAIAEAEPETTVDRLMRQVVEETQLRREIERKNRELANRVNTWRK